MACEHEVIRHKLLISTKQVAPWTGSTKLITAVAFAGYVDDK